MNHPVAFDNIEKIVIFRALFLGDLFFTLPAFRALRERFPNAEITLIGLPWAKEFVSRFSHYLDRFLEFPGYPGIIEVDVNPTRTQEFLIQARDYGYDLAIQMQGNGTTSNGFVAELGARISLGHAVNGDDRLTISIPFTERPIKNEILRWLDLVSLLGAHSTPDLEFPIYPHERARAEELIRPALYNNGPIVGMHMGAKEDIRRWPAQKFGELAKILVKLFDATIVLTGTSQEIGLSKEVEAAVGSNVVNLIGKTDLGTFAAVVSSMDLLVTNDTGASHIAAATGTPSVVLFGPTTPEQFGPINQDLHKAVKAYEHVQSYSGSPLWELPVEPVLDACIYMLQNYYVKPSTAF